MSPKSKLNGQAVAERQHRMNTMLDKTIPFPLRHTLLRDVVSNEDEPHRLLVHQLLDEAAKRQADVLAAQELAEVQGMMNALQAGPLRPATFVGRLEMPISGPARVQVRLTNGENTLPIVTDPQLLASLRCGDGVLLDAQARCVL